MTTSHPPVDSSAAPEPTGAVGNRDPRCVRATAALAELIDKVLAGPSTEVADVVNQAQSLGETAASALLDAGDLRAWELAIRVTSEVTALARSGWIPPGSH